MGVAAQHSLFFGGASGGRHFDEFVILSDADFDCLRDQLTKVGVHLAGTPASGERLRNLRRSYEPFLEGLSHSLMMPLPLLWSGLLPKDNCQSSPRGFGEAHL